jgi:anti-sigma factor RsiW
MDHEVAANTHAVERYLLGEMPASERDSFEEHYFACAECAKDVRSGSELTRDLKFVLREFPSHTQVSSPSWSSWFRMPVMVPSFAALVLAVVVGYQNMAVLPDLEAPRSMTPPVTLDGRTRGDVPSLRAGEPLRFLTAVEGAAAAPLRVEVLNPAGSALRRGEVAAPSEGRPLDVYFPGSLSAGRYDLVVRAGKNGKELTRSTFEIVQ